MKYFEFISIVNFFSQILHTGIFGYIGAKDNSTPNRCLVSLKLHTPLYM